MFKNTVGLFLLIIGLLFSPTSTEAALKSSKTTAADNPAASYNPKAAEGDLELPMPCGLKMVLRPVAIPAKGPLDDKTFKMGLRNLGSDRGFYEKQIAAHISAPFRQENLPKQWQSQLPSDEKNAYYYYFIGKYEITNAQWAAVMEGKETTEKGDRPKTDISWYDLQAFLLKYNEWLLRNHPESVPSIDKVPAFLRLPTEEEWEFAARGGNLPPEIQEEEDFNLVDGKKVEDYAVFGSRYDEPMPIGSRTANRLGIYDMAGNVAEFVQSGFRFTISDRVIGGGHVRRLHGSEGGLVIKGGSFMSSEDNDVYPGKRDEIKMFDNIDGSFGPYHTRSLGARLVLAAVNVPGVPRIEALKKDELRLNKTVEASVAMADERLKKTVESPVQAATRAEEPQTKPVTSPAASPAEPQDRSVTINPDGDPLQELDKLLGAASSVVMKSNLEQFRDLLQDVNASLNRERDENLLNTLRAAIYQADALRNIAFRCYELKNRIRIANTFKGVIAEIKKQGMTIINPDNILSKKQEEQVNGVIITLFKDFERSTKVYKRNVTVIANYPLQEVDNKLLQLKKEYSGDNKSNRDLRTFIEVFSNHVHFVRKQGNEKLTYNMIWDKLIQAESVRSYMKELAKENSSQTIPKKGK